MKTTNKEKLEAIEFYVDDIKEEITNVINENPTKQVMIAYMNSWRDQLNTIKGII
jgi:hypothetical protein